MRGQLRLATAPTRTWPGVIRLLAREQRDQLGTTVDAWGQEGRPKLPPVCKCKKPARQRNEDGDLICIRCGRQAIK